MAVREGPAGTFVAAAVDRSVFPNNTLTHVTTDHDSVVVHGAFSGLRGSKLVIAQFNQRTGLRLCTARTQPACALLAGVWAGPLRPTPAAATVVDFQRYGLTTGSLADWLGLGVLAVLVVVLVGVLESCARGDADDSSDAAP